MNVGTEAEQYPEKEYIKEIFLAVWDLPLLYVPLKKKASHLNFWLPPPPPPPPRSPLSYLLARWPQPPAQSASLH